MGERRAVCLLYMREDGRILAVSRKHDHTKFGLPGGTGGPRRDRLGKLLVREVREETGLAVSFRCSASVQQ